ncbi:MAG: hypothetical protein Roseis2KO_13470 [Roseivirga sp.]
MHGPENTFKEPDPFYSFIYLAMLIGKAASFIDNYFKRFASPKALIGQPLAPGCQIIIVIPCYNEPDLTGTLNSLKACLLPGYPVEVIIVVNQSEAESSEIASANARTIAEFGHWHKEYMSRQTPGTHCLNFHCLKALELPKKQAGVGLARKTGMDEALKRFVSAGTDGAIVCLDADCRVSNDYLAAIDSQFVQSKAGLGEMHFEHDYIGETNEALRKGIVNYELFLRYYVEGLRQSAFPNAIHTIGSCMLVKASVYAKHGGMNKRKAGEDFYFLHKIVPHERFVTVNEGTVFPSCRTSDRVPFGTGKAQQDWLDQNSEQYLTYDPRVFSDLRNLIESAHRFYDMPFHDVISLLEEPVSTFLTHHKFESKIALIKANCKSESQFLKQFFIWFDGFLCMKFVHFLRDEFYPNIPIEEAAAKLIKTDQKYPEKLLESYRAIDRQQVL